MQSLSTRQQIFKQRRFRWMFVVFLAISALIGLAVVPIERSTGNITNVSDGLWWAAQTVTTVGYGDRFPVTDQGRILGVALQIVGAMMFGVMIAMVSNYFSRIQDEFYWNRLFERLDRLENQLDELQKRTGYIVKQDEANSLSDADPVVTTTFITTTPIIQTNAVRDVLQGLPESNPSDLEI